MSDGASNGKALASMRRAVERASERVLVEVDPRYFDQRKLRSSSAIHQRRAANSGGNTVLASTNSLAKW